MISVVCALLIKDHKILITRRPHHKSEGLKWEFPGGKVEPGESEKSALVREIAEELSIKIAPVKLAASVTTNKITLRAWECRWESGDIKLTEHEAYAWVPVSTLHTYDLSHADRLLLPQLAGRIGN